MKVAVKDGIIYLSQMEDKQNIIIYGENDIVFIDEIPIEMTSENTEITSWVTYNDEYKVD